MKRDMDLVRAILLAIEGGTTEFDHEASLDGHDASPEVVSNHLHLLEQAGLVEVQAKALDATYIRGLTWAGHEFIDTVRDPEIWRETKNGGGKVGSWGIGIMKDLAEAVEALEVASDSPAQSQSSPRRSRG